MARGFNFYAGFGCAVAIVAGHVCQATFGRIVLIDLSGRFECKVVIFDILDLHVNLTSWMLQFLNIFAQFSHNMTWIIV